MEKKQKISNTKILIVLLTFTLFLGTTLIPPMRMWIMWPLILWLFYYVYLERKNLEKWEKCIIFVPLLVIISCFVSQRYNAQPFSLTLFYSYPFLGLLSYFFMRWASPSSKNTFIVLKRLFYIVVFCYFLQVLIYPIVLFGSALGDINLDSGHFRMRFVCSLSFFLLFMYGFNQYYIGKGIKNLLYCVLGGLPIIIMGFRSLTTLAVLAAFLMLFFTKKELGHFIKHAIVFFIAAIVALQMPIVQEKMDEMMERQNTDQTFQNEDYVRFISLAYYDSYFNERPLVRFLGGGYPLVTYDGPQNASNKYQAYVSSGVDSGLMWNDLGIIGLSYIIGIPAVVILLILCIRCIILCRDPELQYIRFALLVSILGSIMTSQEIYRDGNFLLLGVLFYYVRVYNENKSLQ